MGLNSRGVVRVCYIGVVSLKLRYIGGGVAGGVGAHMQNTYTNLTYLSVAVHTDLLVVFPSHLKNKTKPSEFKKNCKYHTIGKIICTRERLRLDLHPVVLIY